MWKKLLIVGLLLVLVLVAVSAVLISRVDPNEYRGAIAQLVEEHTGRELRISGDLHMKLWPTPSVEAHDVAFDNASWASTSEMVRAKRARAEFALLPMLTGRAVIHRLVAIEPEVFLEIDADGRSNWMFGDEKPAVDDDSATDAGDPDSGLGTVISAIRIEHGSLEFRDQARDTRINVDLEELAIGSDEPGGPVRLKLRGAYQGVPLTLAGRWGDAGAILANRPVELDVEGSVGRADFSLRGTVGKPLEAGDLRLDVALKATATKPLTELAGIDVEEVGPVDLALTLIEKDGRIDLDGVDLRAKPRHADVTVEGTVVDVVGNARADVKVALSAKSLRQLDATLPDVGPVSLSADVRPVGKVVEIRNLVTRVGKSDLSGSATVDTSGDTPRASATLRAKVIDLAELAPAVKGEADPAQVTEQPGTNTGSTRDGVAGEGGDEASVSEPVGRRVFSAAPLPLDALEKANGDIKLTVDRLITPRITLDKVDVAAELAGGNLTVKPAAQVAGGRIGGIIDIDARARPAKVTADVDASKVSIGTLTKSFRGYETSKGLDSDLAMKLSSQGDSVRDLMGGLDGDIHLEIGEGTLYNDVLHRVGADLLTQIVSVAIPSDEKDDTTEMKCGVVRFAIRDGDAVADETLVLETDRVLLQGGGLIDLKTEGLDLGANLAARKGIRLGAGTLSSLLRVRGTIAEPQIGTDLKGLVKTGTRVGVAVATVGLSLLAETVYGHVSEDEHPCRTALARQIEVTPKKAAETK